MRGAVRIAVVVVAALLVVALLAWARGNPHHHGLDVGSLGQNASIRTHRAIADL